MPSQLSSHALVVVLFALLCASVSARHGRPAPPTYAEGISFPDDLSDPCRVVSVWPKPASLTCGHGNPLTIDLDVFGITFSPSSAMQSSARLEAAFARALAKIEATPTRQTRGLFYEPQWTFPDDDDDDVAASLVGARAVRAVHDVQNVRAPPTLAVLGSLVVSVDNDETPFPVLDDDESYSLVVPAGGDAATLTAATVWGALRGLETFTQLVSRADDRVDSRPPREATGAGVGAAASSALVVLGAPLAIADAPRYPWRGVLLDTANHFLPVATIEGFLEAMSVVKMNVLHWHIVDSYGFPFVSASVPDLAQHGAWAFPAAAYSPGDVAGVVTFAADRGIRVVRKKKRAN